MSDEQTIQERLIQLDGQLHKLGREMEELLIRQHRGELYVNEPPPINVVNLFEGDDYIKAATLTESNRKEQDNED